MLCANLICSLLSSRPIQLSCNVPFLPISLSRLLWHFGNSSSWIMFYWHSSPCRRTACNNGLIRFYDILYHSQIRALFHSNFLSPPFQLMMMTASINNSINCIGVTKHHIACLAAPVDRSNWQTKYLSFCAFAGKILLLARKRQRLVLHAMHLPHAPEMWCVLPVSRWSNLGRISSSKLVEERIGARNCAVWRVCAIRAFINASATFSEFLALNCMHLGQI